MDVTYHSSKCLVRGSAPRLCTFKINKLRGDPPCNIILQIVQDNVGSIIRLIIGFNFGVVSQPCKWVFRVRETYLLGRAGRKGSPNRSAAPYDRFRDKGNDPSLRVARRHAATTRKDQ